MPDDRYISGTFQYREKLFGVVADPDGMRWAFAEDGEEESAADVTRIGERLSADIPDWARDFARDAREAWEDSLVRLERSQQENFGNDLADQTAALSRVVANRVRNPTPRDMYSFSLLIAFLIFLWCSVPPSHQADQ
ncbi:MAG: hypothetical protein KF861_01160 [Planctomycetaceae bacterium]|nr:hypothetical protein [Planctomycetaceae bacterium]